MRATATKALGGHLGLPRPDFACRVGLVGKGHRILVLLAPAVALGLVATIAVTFTAPLSAAEGADTTLPTVANPNPQAEPVKLEMFQPCHATKTTAGTRWWVDSIVRPRVSIASFQNPKSLTTRIQRSRSTT